MTLEEAKVELEKFVSLKTTMRPAFVQPLMEAVEVVRCKNCVYFWDGVCTAHTDAICTDENEFCSWGERR